MMKFSKYFIHLVCMLTLAIASFSAVADVVVDMASVDEITITNTQEADTYSIKIDEPQPPVSYEGSDENLAVMPSVETEEVVVAENDQFEDAESTAINLNGDLINYIDTEVSIKSAYSEEGNVLVTINTTHQPKHAVASKTDTDQLSRSLPYNKEVLIAAKKTKVEPALIHAIISAESNYNPRAKSQKGAVGLMQIMPATAKFYQVKDRSDPQQNIIAGASLLRDLLKEFKGDIKLSLAAYNAGLPAVLKHQKKIPPYKETQRYVPKVLKTYKHLSKFI